MILLLVLVYLTLNVRAVGLRFSIDDLIKVFYKLALVTLEMGIVLSELKEPENIKGILIQNQKSFLYYKSPTEYLMIKRENKKWL